MNRVGGIVGVVKSSWGDMRINKNDDNNDINININNSKNCVIWMLVSDV